MPAKVDVSTILGKFYDVSKMDIVKGTKFSLNQDDATTTDWFFNNDAVLDITVQPKKDQADIDALEIGTSTIFLMTEQNITKTLTINVIAEVLPVITDLGVTDGGVTVK